MLELQGLIPLYNPSLMKQKGFFSIKYYLNWIVYQKICKTDCFFPMVFWFQSKWRGFWGHHSRWLWNFLCPWDFWLFLLFSLSVQTQTLLNQRQYSQWSLFTLCFEQCVLAVTLAGQQQQVLSKCYEWGFKTL